MDPIVILGDERVAVAPGQEQRLPVRIRNQGRRVESYRVDVVGGPSAFAEVLPSVVSVLPGREVQVDVIFRPPGGAGTPTGSLPFAVRARSEVDAASSAATGGQLELSGVAGLQAWAPETTRTGRWSSKFHLEFANQGNAAARLVLTAHDPAGSLKLQLQPDVVDLPPGGRTTTELKAKARAPFLKGSPVNRMIQVASQTYAFGAPKPEPGGVAPKDDPNHRTFQLTFQQRPILPKFAIPLLLLLVVALLAVAIVTLRREQRPELGLAPPVAPSAFNPPLPGSESILLSWVPVPNAEAYRIDRTHVNGQENQQVLAEELAPDARSYEVPNLTPGTEYCFAIRALGAGARSEPLEQCASTNPPTQLAAPPAPTAVHESGQYRVSWDYPNAPPNVQFLVLVDGNPFGPYPLQNVVITIASTEEERQVSIRVRAELDGQVSELSPEFLLTVEATPPPSTQPTVTTEPSSSTPATATTSPTTTVTTTIAPPTATTPPVPVVSELHNIDPAVIVAMLGPVVPPAQGGPPIDQRKAELAARFGVVVDELEVFTNRDTLVSSPDRSTMLDFAGASASARYIYVRRNDAAAAQEVCNVAPAENCFVLQLIGAAADSEGDSIAILRTLPAQTSTADVDEELDSARDSLSRDSIHVLDGGAYRLTNGPIIYATGFASAADADAFCAASQLPPAGCIVQPLAPPG